MTYDPHPNGWFIVGLAVTALAAFLLFGTPAQCHGNCGGYCSPTQIVCAGPGCSCNFVTSSCW